MTEETSTLLKGDDTSLTAIDRRHVSVSRIVAAIMSLFPLIGASVLEFAHLAPSGTFLVPVTVLAIFAILIVPPRKYRRWGYHMGSDRLRVVSGYMFFSDTIVPFGRVQHIDVNQGPIQRPYGLATLTVHTAGNHNSTVSLPGLAHADALDMRENIRAHIKRDTL